MKKIGTINGCNIAYLINGQGIRIGETLDTPNAIACAMANNTEIYNSVSYYQLFGKNDITALTWRIDLNHVRIIRHY